MIFLSVFCALAIVFTEPVAAKPLSVSDDRSVNTSQDHSAAPAARENDLVHYRVRREKDATKAPRVIKYYDADSPISGITILAEDGKLLNPRIKYMNTAFVPDSNGHLVKAPKDQKNKTENLAAEDNHSGL